MVEKNKKGIEHRNKSENTAGNDEFFEPIVFYAADISNGTGHSEKRNPSCHGCPLGTLTGEHILFGRHVGREEEACDYCGNSLFAVIKPHAPAVDKIIGTGSRVIKNSKNGRKNRHCGNSKSDNGFHCNKDKTAEFVADVFVRNADEEIKNGKNNFADEEPVVYNGVYCNGSGKKSVFIFGDEHLKSDENEREKRNHIKKMVEEKVVDAVSAERIKKSADNSKTLVFYKSCK